jgi:hypothetical protein
MLLTLFNQEGCDGGNKANVMVWNRLEIRNSVYKLD